MSLGLTNSGLYHIIYPIKQYGGIIMPRGNPGIKSEAKSSASRLRWGNPEFRDKMQSIMSSQSYINKMQERKTKSPLMRFDSKVYKQGIDNCWIWNGTRTTLGYGVFSVDSKLIYVHRWAYEYFNKPIPENMTIDHICRNPSCVNPRHLEVVTQRINVQRGKTGSLQIRKTHCPRGHPYDDTNTIIRRDDSRVCRICNKEYQRNWLKKRKLMHGST